MLKTKINTILLCTLFTLFFPLSAGAQYRNPILYADVPDMSVCRAGDYFYMVSTTMHLMPGAPIMRSPDMKHWETISYVFPRIDDGPRYDLLEGTAYGQGQWASSIRYHDGKFYVWFTANGAPGRGFVYTATDPAGPWKLLSRPPHFHDGSLLFDDDGRVYLFHSTGQLTELKPDLTDVLPGGINQQIFERDADEQGLLEGSSVIKHNGKYYLLMISMDWSIPGRLRREVCYRADKITGPYEKRVILETEFDGHGGVGQGCIVDGKNGEWYGLIFQDRGGVGRVPCLMPCTWTEDGWPMLGDKDGHIPNDTTLSYMSMDGICGSDDFSASGLSLYWQWNHNPVDQAWSLTDRPGFLRLKTSRVVDNLFVAPNTLTQRMVGPKCMGTVSLSLGGMKDGDRAGLSAFNGDSGVLTIEKNGNKLSLVMSEQKSVFEKTKRAISRVDMTEQARIPLNKELVYLRVEGDFTNGRDEARFSYSLDGKAWIPVGLPIKMKFDYTRMFMGKSLTYPQTLALTDRLDYLGAHQNRHALCMCIEKAMGIEVSERVQYIRTIMDELQRIDSHLLFYSCLAMDLGALTAFFYGFRDREKILDIFEETCGGRLIMNYNTIGGVQADLHPNFVKRVKEFIPYMRGIIHEYHDIFTGNIIAQSRMKGVGVLSREDAISFGCTGGTGRASGWACDVRKRMPYGVYDKVDFKEIVYTEGDCFARYLVRMDEIMESLNIIEQLIDNIPEGPYQEKMKPIIRVPEGSYYAAVEGSRGEFGVFLESQGDKMPYRLHYRATGLPLVAAIDTICRGTKIADLIAIGGTIDYVVPDIDR